MTIYRLNTTDYDSYGNPIWLFIVLITEKADS